MEKPRDIFEAYEMAAQIAEPAVLLETAEALELESDECFSHNEPYRGEDLLASAYRFRNQARFLLEHSQAA